MNCSNDEKKLMTVTFLSKENKMDNDYEVILLVATSHTVSKNIYKQKKKKNQIHIYKYYYDIKT